MGTAGAAVALLGFFRDRPHLSLSINFGIKRGFSPEIVATVHNTGRQPTTVMEVGLVTEGQAEIVKEGMTIATGNFTLGLDDDRPEVVLPGQVIQLGVSLSRWPGPVHADEPLRLYAIALPNRRVWGPSAPILRALLNSGWKPSDAAPEVMRPLPNAPVRPKAVEPWWKLWADKELRKPSLPPPQAWPPRHDVDA